MCVCMYMYVRLPKEKINFSQKPCRKKKNLPLMPATLYKGRTKYFKNAKTEMFIMLKKKRLKYYASCMFLQSVIGSTSEECLLLIVLCCPFCSLLYSSMLL